MRREKTIAERDASYATSQLVTVSSMVHSLEIGLAGDEDPKSMKIHAHSCVWHAKELVKRLEAVEETMKAK